MSLVSIHIDQPYNAWLNIYNQKELLGLADTIDFGDFIIIDCSVNEDRLRKIFDSEIMKDNRRIIMKALESIELLRWFLLPDSADADYALFVCDLSHSNWIEELKMYLKNN